MLGDGVSIDPTEGKVYAPFDGEVLSIPDSRHAINLRADNQAEFLIHVGVDSVSMQGDGFEAHVAAGEKVVAGQLLLSFDLNKVLRFASSLKTPVLLLSDGFQLCNPAGAGRLEHGAAIFEVRAVSDISAIADGEVHTSNGQPSIDEGAGDRADQPSSKAGPQCSQQVIVGLEHGIHARPAAGLKTAAAGFDASVTIEMGEQPAADVRSPVALMSLGVSFGSAVLVSAEGQQAEQALHAVVELLEPLDPGSNDALDTASPGASDQVAAQTDPRGPLAEGTVISAQIASPGLSMGKAFVLETWNAPSAQKVDSIEIEQQQLRDALTVVARHLQNMSATGETTGSQIAVAHLAMLEDPAIVDTAERLVLQGQSASHAWHESVLQSVDMLQQLDDRRMLERVDDLKDIDMRVQRALAGQDLSVGIELPEKTILVAENLFPSQLLELDASKVVGLCTSAGGTTSHVAILAVSMGIPMLVAAGSDLLAVRNGDPILLDADFGELQVKPAAATADNFAKRIEDEHQSRLLEQAAAKDECLTSDGTRVHFRANLASPGDAATAVEAGAEGCGLLRTEFIFMSRSQAPDMHQQLDIYQQISDSLQGRPMVVRTLDAGGDKPISYLHQQVEENPALGVRGIRLSLSNRTMLEVQLGALINLKRSTPLQVMIPMVTSVHEVTEVRDIIDSLCEAKGFENPVRLGIMIETPAAALIADRLAALVDFFSIGTNDLTQYTLSMDRGEPQLAARLDVLHPAVLKLIKMTADAANDADIEVAVCGGAAGDMLAAPVLLGLGIHELSMPQSLIARQKMRLRKLSMAECRSLADTALSMSSARGVRAMMRNFYGN